MVVKFVLLRNWEFYPPRKTCFNIKLGVINYLSHETNSMETSKKSLNNIIHSTKQFRMLHCFKTRFTIKLEELIIAFLKKIISRYSLFLCMLFTNEWTLIGLWSLENDKQFSNAAVLLTNLVSFLKYWNAWKCFGKIKYGSLKTLKVNCNSSFSFFIFLLSFLYIFLQICPFFYFFCWT